MSGTSDFKIILKTKLYYLMAMKKYDVFGIGSALMDLLIEIEPKELLEIDLKHGEMHLIDEEKSKKILEKLKKYNVKIAPGGSSANTLVDIARLGGKVVFCGKVGRDSHGDIYEQKLKDHNIKSNISQGSLKTGHAITFITPDSQRTFATHLGATLELKKEDIFAEDIKASKILHIEGYQLEDKNLREAAIHAMDIAKKNNVKISIDLSDPALVKRNIGHIRPLVKKYAGIVFANEEEAREFTGQEPEKALDSIAEFCGTVIIKRGKKGSLIKHNGKVYQIPCVKAKAIDTTGAGDAYAAGILYSLANNYDIKIAGEIGSLIASKVVEKIGARLDEVPYKEIEKIKNKKQLL